MKWIFEVSWDACQSEGELSQFLYERSLCAVQSFASNYVVLGPDRPGVCDFMSTDEPQWDSLDDALAEEGLDLSCRYGRWNIPGMPQAILLKKQSEEQQHALLYKLSQEHGIDFLEGSWDAAQPVLFALSASCLLKAAHRAWLDSADSLVVNAHQWQSSACLVALSKTLPKAARVFSMHSTVLGGCLAQKSISQLNSPLDEITKPETQASDLGLLRQHRLEAKAAQTADMLSVSSESLMQESQLLLHKEADAVIPDGLHVQRRSDRTKQLVKFQQDHEHIRDYAQRFLGKHLPEQTKFVLLPAAHQFKAQGMDLFLKSLKSLDDYLKKTQKGFPVVAWIFSENSQSIREKRQLSEKVGRVWGQLVTHELVNPQKEPIVELARRLGLNNDRDNQVHLIYCPLSFDRVKEILPLSPEQFLAASELFVAPGFDEKANREVLNALSTGVPVVASDASSAGYWFSRLNVADQKCFLSLERKKYSEEQLIEQFRSFLYDFCSIDDQELFMRGRQARRLAGLMDWKKLYPAYEQLYNQAIERSEQRRKVKPSMRMWFKKKQRIKHS